MVKKAHRVLKCRHYSLYDLRIDADEQPYILEAALFCSFSPLSVIPAMAQHAGREDLRHPKLFHSFLERAIAEKPQQAPIVQPTGPPSPMLDTLSNLGTNANSDDSSSRSSSHGESS